jgi:hypothetical protein
VESDLRRGDSEVSEGVVGIGKFLRILL